MKRRTLLLSLATCGSAWSAPVSPALDRRAVTVRAPSRAVLLGAALAGERFVAVGERGLAVVSDDGCRTWRQAQVPVSVSLTAVAFADERHGYATGHGGTVLRTTDGGLTWARQLDGRAIATMMQESAMRGGDAAQRKAADRMVADGPDKPLLDLVVSSPSEVFVVGAFGMALATADGGNTWAVRSGLLDNPKDLHLYAVRRRAQVIAIAGEQGLFLRSDDGGHSFRKLTLPYQGSFFTLELPSERDIITAGMRGNVWRSADAGSSWQQLSSPSPAAIIASTLRQDGSFVLASQAGQLLSSTGASLEVLKTPSLPPLTGVLPLPGKALLALSVEGVHLLPPVVALKNTN
ncbi:YCF48-related protein [Variovorax sp. LjRoot130]|uniref:WD40/YVTN/BNR-like repeat-containing protein n=1 Tax=Variovorax sp. LjRoot175 TaxID=3342276 RepID=UPI003ED0B460